MAKNEKTAEGPQKQIKTPPYTAYNKFFIIPFLLWVITGGILLALFSKQQLFSIVNTHYTTCTDILMAQITWMGEPGFIVVILLVLSGAYALRNTWYFAAAILCNVIPVLVIQILKGIFNEPRPLLYFNNAAWLHINQNWHHLYYYSFPSGHSAAAFSLFCFVSLLLPYRYRYWATLFFFLALATAYSRIYLAAHFFKDVYFGSITGTLITLLMFTLIKFFQPKFFKNPGSEV